MNNFALRPLGHSLVVGFSICALSACSSDSPAAVKGPTTNGGAPGVAGSGGLAGAVGSGVGGAAAGTVGTIGGGGDSSAGSGGSSAGSGGSSAGSGGSSAGSGGSSAGSGGSSTGGGGAAACPGTFCDDFERSALGADWTIDNGIPANKVELVSNKGHSGTSSVHITLGTASGSTFISESKTFPAADNAIWGRAWVYMTAVPLSTHQVYVEARNATADAKSGVRTINTGVNGATKFLGVNLENGDAGKASTIAPKMDAWVCWEWQITGIGSTTGAFSGWADSVLIGTLTNQAITALTRVRIGMERFGTGPSAGEMWIDDVAFGPTRLNCN